MAELGGAGIPGNQDLAILDRRDEHARLRRMRIPRREILERQKIDERTFWEDEAILLEESRKAFSRSATLWFEGLVMRHSDIAESLHACVLDERQDLRARAMAARSEIMALDKLAHLFRFYQATTTPSQPDQPAQQPATIDNRQQIIVADMDMAAIIRRELDGLASRLPAGTMETFRQELGPDNIKQVGEVLDIDADDIDDDEL